MERQTCARCVLTEFRPDITLDAEGICNVCRAYENNSSQPVESPLLETDFIRLIEKYRGKGKYDCLVMCSGGKDSTASLYFMKKRYRMTPLAFTFDLGFETEEAMANVHNAVDALGVDLVIHKSGFLKEMFRRILESDSKVVLCHPCSIWYMQLTFETARRYDTPLIIAGWTKGQAVRKQDTDDSRYGDQAPEYATMTQATREFIASLADDPRYADFPPTMEEVLRRARKQKKCTVQSPHWYLPGGTEDHVETLQRELGWKYPVQSYPKRSTNCALNFLSVGRSLEHYGYTHYHVEMSKLIRRGLMTREEAIERLEPKLDEAMLREIAARCGCSQR